MQKLEVNKQKFIALKTGQLKTLDKDISDFTNEPPDQGL